MYVLEGRGFSLVEVAIALGIASFVILAMLGLLAVGIGAGKQATEDTVAAAITRTVFSDLETNSYQTIVGTDFSRYFDYAGTALADGSNAFYQCRVEAVAHSSSELPGALGKTNHAVRVRVSLIWPSGTQKTNAVLETTLARY